MEHNSVIPGMPENRIGAADKLNLALILAAFLWVLDYSLDLTVPYIAFQTFPVRLVWGISLFIILLLLPFFFTQRIFKYAVWQRAPHEVSDRLIVVVLGITLQLAADTFIFQSIYWGEFWVSFLHLTVCAFGAMSDYRPIEENIPYLQASNPRNFSAELRGKHLRAKAVSVVLLAAFIIRRAGHSNNYISFMLLFFAAAALLFTFIHNRCPRCGGRISSKKEKCPKCGLE